MCFVERGAEAAVQGRILILILILIFLLIFIVIIPAIIIIPIPIMIMDHHHSDDHPPHHGHHLDLLRQLPQHVNVLVRLGPRAILSVAPRIARTHTHPHTPVMRSVSTGQTSARTSPSNLWYASDGARPRSTSTRAARAFRRRATV